MKNFLATTAVALVLGTTAFAGGQTGAFSDIAFDNEVNLNASDIIGMRVYASESDIKNNMVAIDGEKEWDDIGEINEIILTRSGEVQSVIVGVGGFLGMSEKDVAINMDQLQFVTEEGELDDYFLVVKANAVGVQDAPRYDRDMGAMDADNMEAHRTPLMIPSVDREGYSDVVVKDLNTEDLTGARVFGVSDEDIGEVSELLIDESGQINRAVIDVGGFLGLGEYPVAVPLNELQIIRKVNGDDLRVYIESSQEALEAQPEYKG